MRVDPFLEAMGISTLWVSRQSAPGVTSAANNVANVADSVEVDHIDHVVADVSPAMVVDWMVVDVIDVGGEAVPGQAALLLDNMLAALGIARGAGVANVVIAPAGDYQQQRLRVKPKIILALGEVAAQSVLRTSSESPSFSALRGRVHEHDGVPVVVTHHPAHLLRHLSEKADVWEDLCLARRTLAEAAL